MKITSDQIRKVLAGKGVAEQCPACGSKSTTIYVDGLGAAKFLLMVSIDHGIEAAGVNCDNCGHIRLFDLETIARNIPEQTQ